MLEIRYVKGDATNPIGDDMKIISHITNDKGRWGSGFVLALSKKWKQPEIAYYLNKTRKLTDVDFIRVENDIIVANMIAQKGIGKDVDGNPPINYAALRICLNKVNDHAYKTSSSIHMPRIGAGLAGGDWKTIETIIKDVMSVPVTVYDFN